MKSQLIVFVFTLFFFGICSNIFSQDIILLKSGEEIKTKVQEVGIDKINYKKFENLTGPTYTVEKSKVFMITYENGTKDVFEKAVEPVNTVKAIINEQVTSTEQIIQPVKQKLDYLRSGIVTLNGKLLTKEECLKIISEDKDALKKYNSGKLLMKIGNGLAGADLGYSLFMGFKINQGYVVQSPAVVLGIAFGGLASSIVVTVIGWNKVKKAVYIYNSKIKE